MTGLGLPREDVLRKEVGEFVRLALVEIAADVHELQVRGEDRVAVIAPDWNAILGSNVEPADEEPVDLRDHPLVSQRVEHDGPSFGVGTMGHPRSLVCITGRRLLLDHPLEPGESGSDVTGLAEAADGTRERCRARKRDLTSMERIAGRGIHHLLHERECLRGLSAPEVGREHLVPDCCLRSALAKYILRTGLCTFWRPLNALRRGGILEILESALGAFDILDARVRLDKAGVRLGVRQDI